MNERVAWLLAILVFLANYVAAADKALLVGIEKYKYPNAFQPSIDSLNLPGVHKDIIAMHLLLASIGFVQQNIRQLVDQQATEYNIKSTIQGWLSAGTGHNDRIVIYFSTHGSYVWDDDGDEGGDDRDEVLLTYDAHFEQSNQEYILQGKLLDDDMQKLLSVIPSRRVFVIVDACHSGTIDRSSGFSQEAEWKPKFADNPYFKQQDRQIDELASLNRLGITDMREWFEWDDYQKQNEGIVYFTATGEDQQAYATQEGSLFTKVIVEEALKQWSQKKSVDLTRLRDYSRTWFSSNSPGLFSPQPELFGDPILIKQGL